MIAIVALIQMLHFNGVLHELKMDNMCDHDWWLTIFWIIARRTAGEDEIEFVEFSIYSVFNRNCLFEKYK